MRDTVSTLQSCGFNFSVAAFLEDHPVDLCFAVFPNFVWKFAYFAVLLAALVSGA